MIPKIGILASHPVQYHAPVYRYLNLQAQGQLHVFFCSRTGYDPVLDKGFGKMVQWDIPLLEGYESTFLPLENQDPGPGLHYFSRFWPLFHAQGCEVLLVWNTYSSLSFPRYLWEAHVKKVPVIYRGDTYQNPKESIVKKLAKKLYLSWLFRWVDRFLATGTWSVQFYRNLGIPSSRITVAPYAIDNDFFRERSSELRSQRESIRESLGIKPETVVFNLTGKYQPSKRPLDLIRGATLSRDLPIHLLLVGEGKMRYVLEREIRQLNLTNVTLTGFVNQSELPRYYVASDVAVVSSTYNPWITVVNESMCCGLPLLLSDAVGAGADLLIENENGHKYPMGNIAELAQFMQKFFEYGAAKQQMMGDRSMEIINRWGIHESVQGFLEAAASLKRHQRV